MNTSPKYEKKVGNTIIRYRTRDLENILDEINNTGYGLTLGVQPFGGERLPGSGPKAGGPHYLLRFATERTLTISTTAVGGNASSLELNQKYVA